MNAPRNISLAILIFVLLASFAHTAELSKQPPVQVEREGAGERQSKGHSHIQLIQAEEDESEKIYRWGITRALPLKVVQGWYWFDDEGIREHGGGGRKMAETKLMRLTLKISQQEGFLLLQRGYGWSGETGDQKAATTNKIEWPDNTALKTYYLSERTELTDHLQPLWKGQLLHDGKVLKTIIYAVRVVGENVSDELFDVDDSSEALRTGRAWAPTPDPAKKKYEGRTIDEWIAQWDTRTVDSINRATEALIRIGRPAVPAMIELIKKGGGRASYARKVLGKMGPDAEQAVPWLIETALDKSNWASEGRKSSTSFRASVVYTLSLMTWASDRLLPVFKTIAEDDGDDTSVRRMAISALQNVGEEAIPILRRLTETEQGKIRDSAHGALSKLLEKKDGISKAQYYTQLIESDPFHASVPEYLGRTKGIVNLGQPYPLTQKVKAMYRQRLQLLPDAELAWQLARIIQNGLMNTEFEWAAPTDRGGSQQSREDPAESFETLSEVLLSGFGYSESQSELWLKFGTSLAKLYLLQGDWDGMNAMLKALDQEPIPEESRPLLHAPPVDWGKDLHSRWEQADESMRSGNCDLEFQFEKNGNGLAGIHILIKEAPQPTNVFHTGVRTDTLFFAPYPIEFYRGSFGYRGSDSKKTRYAVSDSSGIVRFDKMPNIPIKIEVLIPTSNFTETGSNWDLWMEVEPDKFKIAKIYGGADAVDWRKPPAVVELKEGETVHYPRLVVRPAFGLNVRDWTRVDKDNFVLSWTPMDSTTQAKTARCELEMSLSAPPDHPYRATHAPVLKSAKIIVEGNRWPVGEKGVGTLRFEPGNIYMFEIRAIDASDTIIARWPRARVWTPWDHRTSAPPFASVQNVRDRPPIHNRVWHYGSFDRGTRRRDGLREKVARFLSDSPDAFEYEYVQLGKAWLDWHDNRQDARRQLEQLVKELPEGNVARGTSIWLLQQIDEDKPPPKRLNFVPDRDTSNSKAAYEKPAVQVEVELDKFLDWSIETSKKTFYPGEPVLLKLKIKNNGDEEVKINFGMDGIEAFSMEIWNSSNKVVAQGGHIQRYGMSRTGTLAIPPGKTGEKSIVLNQWCSTLLPPGKYHVMCHVNHLGRFFFEKIALGDGNYKAVQKRHYLPRVTLESDIEVISSDDSKFKNILDDLVKCELKPKGYPTREWLDARAIAREMIAFTESDLAVPYQIRILRDVQYTRLKWDIINSLAQSGTLEAAKGLLQIFEDPSIYKEDMKRRIIDAIYRLRETEKADIINLTDEFVAKYKRPILSEPVD